MIGKMIRIQFLAGVKDFSLLYSTQTDSEARPAAIHCLPLALSPGVKQLVREGNHPPPFCAKLKNGEAIPQSPHTS
jgi:hypothetical protein